MEFNDLVKAKLSEVYDPELGINIVDLGLVYEVNIDDNKNVNVVMTLTTPGCPLHDSISTGVNHALSSIEGIGEIKVDLVWEPMWTPDKMSDNARERLWGPF